MILQGPNRILSIKIVQNGNESTWNKLLMQMISGKTLLFRGGSGNLFSGSQSLLRPSRVAATIIDIRISTSSSYPQPNSSRSRKFFDHNYFTLSKACNFSSSSSSACGVSEFSKMSSAIGGDGARFKLSDTAALVINKGDITQWFIDGCTDAIVNPANERMLGGSGADGAIHRAAGPELREACYKVPEVRPGVRCPTGEARITPGFKLPASHVIHTVGPIYDAEKNPEASLRSAYRNSLSVAKENNIQYIAFTAISCGVYGYPLEEAATVAISTVKEFANDFKEVHFVLFSDDIYNVWVKKAKELL